MVEVKEIEEIKCPKCGSEDFSERAIEPTGFAEYIIMSYMCNNCETKFQVEYTAIEIKIVE